MAIASSTFTGESVCARPGHFLSRNQARGQSFTGESIGFGGDNRQRAPVAWGVETFTGESILGKKSPNSPCWRVRGSVLKFKQRKLILRFLGYAA